MFMLLGVIIGSIYFILLDELIMGCAQRRIGPLNIGWYGFLSSLINGCNLINLGTDVMVRLLNNHFTFYISYLGMNYSNVIGFLLFLVFILQFISGLLLSCYYSPFSTMAFDSVYYIMIDVNVGWLIRWLHCLGASLFMLFILIHWIRGAWIRLKVIELCFYCDLYVLY